MIKLLRLYVSHCSFKNLVPSLFPSESALVMNSVLWFIVALLGHGFNQATLVLSRCCSQLPKM